MLVVLASVEAALFFVEDRLSLDLSHVGRIPLILQELKQAEPSHVLFLGNSLTREGIRPRTIENVWNEQSLPKAAIALVHPDDTGMPDWLYLYRRFVEPADVDLDLLVVSFANRNLEDTAPLNIERLGGRLGGFPVMREAFARDISSAGDRIRYILSATFRLWADRERVQTRVLALIPGYETFAQVANVTVRDGTSKGALHDPTYDRLGRFLEAARKKSSTIVFVAVPTPGGYPLSDRLRDVIRDAGASLIDLRKVEGVNPGDFPDGYHLGPAGAVRFSEALGRAIANATHLRSALLQRRAPLGYPTIEASVPAHAAPADAFR